MNTSQALGQSCSIFGVPAQDVEALWPKVETFVAAALEESRGELSLEDVRTNLLERYMQLWVLYEEASEKLKGCVVTQIIDYPQKRYLRVVILGGFDLSEWVGNWDFIELWARHQKCHGVESYTRRGFVRKLKDAGFSEYYAMVGKDFLPIDVH